MTADARKPLERRLELHGMTKRFGEFTAVAPLDMTIRAGELFVLLGPAGAGKSTVLRLIAGLERATAGEVSIDGLEVTPLPPQRRDVAMVSQHFSLYPHLSVERNLAFPMRAANIPPNAVTRRVDEVIERLQLEGVRRFKPRKLTGEQRQLTSIGRAIVRDCKAFLFDEPLVPFPVGEQREHMRRELRAIHQELRATTVLATRNPIDAMALADRVAVMNAGRVVQCDGPRAVADQPADLFVARLIAPPGARFIDAAVENGSVVLSGLGVSVRVDDCGARPVDPGKITLLVPSGPSGAIDPAACRWFDATSGRALPWRTA